MVQGGLVRTELWRMSFSQVREPIVAGLLTDAEMDAFLALLADPSFAWMEMTLASAWGQRPT